MIQRVQTLWLLIVAALMTLPLFMPLAHFAGEEVRFGLYAFALRSPAGEALQPTIYLGISLALACALPLVTIFLYKRRLLQIRLCMVEIVLLIGAVVMEGVYYYLGGRVFVGQAFHTQQIALVAALPVACLIFTWLASRAIFRDEMMVRAAERIR